jgi:dihydrofolate synthase
VKVGVIEVGMGGARDATNALKHKSLCVISRVGLDHQEFLGNTLEEITREKCGIIAQGVPVIYDEMNEPEVLKEIRVQANRRFAIPVYGPGLTKSASQNQSKIRRVVSRLAAAYGHTPFQLQNAHVAFHAAETFLRRSGHQPDLDAIAEAIATTTVPGRLQKVNLGTIVGHKVKALLDGAHNPQAIESVVQAIFQPIRQKGPVSWIIAFSDGKPLDQMLPPLLRSGDAVAAVEFGSVDGMPWKKAMPSTQIVQYLNDNQTNMHVKVKDFGLHIRDALVWAANENPDSKSLVAIGSLYLVSDILRLVRDTRSEMQSTFELESQSAIPSDIASQDVEYQDLPLHVQPSDIDLHNVLDYDLVQFHLEADIAAQKTRLRHAEQSSLFRKYSSIGHKTILSRKARKNMVPKHGHKLVVLKQPVPKVHQRRVDTKTPARKARV